MNPNKPEDKNRTNQQPNRQDQSKTGQNTTNTPRPGQQTDPRSPQDKNRKTP
jgi:hypothetical protein